MMNIHTWDDLIIWASSSPMNLLASIILAVAAALILLALIGHAIPDSKE